MNHAQALPAKLPLVRTGPGGDFVRDLHDEDVDPRSVPQADVIPPASEALLIEPLRRRLLTVLQPRIVDCSFSHEWGTKHEYELVIQRSTVTIDFQAWTTVDLLDEESLLPFRFIDLSETRDIGGSILRGEWRLTLDRIATAGLWLRRPDRLICLYTLETK